MSIGEVIRAKREAANMTTVELARRVDVTQSMITQIERGTKTVTLPLAANIAKVFSCTVDELLCERECHK